MTTRRRRAFMLIEMIGALILLTVFALIATRLFTWSMRVTQEAPLAQQQIHAFDSMLEALRADVWAAGQVRVGDEQSVSVGDVSWTVGDDGAVVQTAGDESRAWPGVGERVRFEVDDAGVVVRVLDRRGTVVDRVVVVSEVALIRRVGK